jgi:antitoxin component YwqK of YwqJK toxin-antitoxin module
MNKLLLTLLLLSSLAQANLGTFKDGKFIYPNTNKPFTGNLEVINHNWGNDSVEFSKDYVDGILHGEVKTYYETGELFEATDFNYGTPKYKAVYRKDGSLADEQGFLNKQIIDSIIS